MLTVNEVAERLKCSPALIYQLCADGRLAHHRLGTGRGTIRITENSLQEFLDTTHVGTHAITLSRPLKHIRLSRMRSSSMQ